MSKKGSFYQIFDDAYRDASSKMTTEEIQTKIDELKQTAFIARAAMYGFCKRINEV